MPQKKLFRSTIKFFRSVFNHRVGYLNTFDAPSCCSVMRRRREGSSSFRDLEELYSSLTSHFEAAAANDSASAKCSTTRRRYKGAKKKVKIQTFDPDVRNPERRSSEIGPVGDQGDTGGRKEKGVDCLVLEKLKEMKSVDERNSEHLMDVEEVIFYYSLITSQTYLDIVNKFFVDLYIEFSDCQILPGSGSLPLDNV
uniref:Uncharacterized protein n=1 Tax=Kalanchoe fedtschenkoi TaxID=63787 RepID=A0A7N0V6J4_KALFE